MSNRIHTPEYYSCRGTLFRVRKGDEREHVAREYEGVSMTMRAQGNFEAAVRWDEYARAMRLRGHTCGITANGQHHWQVYPNHETYIDP